MLFSFLTVLFYSASSLGDKFISAKLNCSVREFSLLVSLATAFFLALLLPFLGWKFTFTPQTCLALLALTACKVVEFYTSAALLKAASAYELKAWLSLNVVFSFCIDLARGEQRFFWAFVPCAAAMAAGILLVILGSGKKNALPYVLLSLGYIASKLFYGLQMNVLPEGTSSVSVLLLVMLAVALIQLPFVQWGQFFRKKGLLAGALTRIPNAAGLWTEAIAAQQNLLLYSLVQPMQLAILFVVALVRREKLGARKVVGTVLTLLSVCALTVLVYRSKGSV